MIYFDTSPVVISFLPLWHFLQVYTTMNQYYYDNKSDTYKRSFAGFSTATLSNKQLQGVFFGFTNKVAMVVLPVIAWRSGGTAKQIASAAVVGPLVVGVVKLQLRIF